MYAFGGGSLGGNSYNWQLICQNNLQYFVAVQIELSWDSSQHCQSLVSSHLLCKWMTESEREIFSSSIISNFRFLFSNSQICRGDNFLFFFSFFSSTFTTHSHTHVDVVFFLISILFSFHVLFSSGNGRSSLDTMSSTVTQGEHQINVGREFCGNLCGVSIRTEKESYIEVETYGST